MSDNVENAMFEILKKVQTELSHFHAETNERFERIELGMRRSQRSSAGMLVMMRATAGDFDQRVNEIEDRVTALESKAS